MRKLWLAALAASTFSVPAIGQTVPDPTPFYGVSTIAAGAAAAAPGGSSAGAHRSKMGGSWGGSHRGPSGPKMRVRPPKSGHHGSGPKKHWSGSKKYGGGYKYGGWKGHSGKGNWGKGNWGKGHYSHHRIKKGGWVPGHWSKRRYQIDNWGVYGFYQPFGGGRWVRYYDDALLVDAYGRVVDTRYGVEWDRYGERWGEDEYGAPAYDEDYDRYEGEYARKEKKHGHHAPPPPPHAYPYGYGYGYCGCAPVLVTETIVTTPAVVEEVTYHEHVKKHAPPPVKRKTKIIHRPPPPPYGEKG